MNRVRLRPTMLSDLDWVVSVEQDAANLPFITPWERTQHEGAIRFPDSRHFIVEAGDQYERAGFVILQGCRNPHHSIELKRLVLQPAVHGQGNGRACVKLLKQMAFRDLKAHRFWLDVKSLNVRALVSKKGACARACASAARRAAATTRWSSCRCSIASIWRSACGARADPSWGGPQLVCRRPLRLRSCDPTRSE
jgi:diamine N-acetyltransferase